METAIKRLRRKYIFSALSIAFCVVLLMLVILNVMMNITYYSDKDAMLDIILRNESGYDYKNEYFILSQMPQNPDGDYIIPRSIESIASVTLTGEIRSKTESEEWYSAGGGLMFKISESDSEPAFAYREYTFNKNTREVTIDFTDLENLKYERDPQAYINSMADQNNFLVSVVWYTSSDKGFESASKDISLELDSIEIHYKDTMNFIPHTNYTESFKDEVPQILDSADSFCIVTDPDGTLTAVNDGNMSSPLDDAEASMLAKQILSTDKSLSVIRTDSGAQYYYNCEKNAQHCIIAFVRKNSDKNFLRQLLFASVVSGAVILLILFVIIVIVSGQIVKPVSETFEKQKQFISNAGHELKTPITVISATTDLLEKQTGPDRWTACIRAQSDKMSRLVNELLELSRLSETHNCRLQFEKFCLSQTVHNTVLYFESRAYEENHPLSEKIDENIMFYGDEIRTERLIGILIDNALKYSDAGSSISIAVNQSRDRVCLSCTNLCSRLNPVEINRLFERFYRCDQPGSEERPGYGLGLSIAQAIAELHNGKIEVSYHSNLVTFSVSLPC